MTEDLTYEYCKLAKEWAMSQDGAMEIAVTNGSLAILLAADAICQRLDKLCEQRPPVAVEPK